MKDCGKIEIVESGFGSAPDTNKPIEEVYMAKSILPKFQPLSTNWRFQNLTGLRFTRLTVLGYAGSISRVTRWWCKCECGTVKSVATGKLRNGHVRSCGCLATDERKKRNTRHGQTGTPTHNIWRGMLSRCRCSTNTSYVYYGRRGIVVCSGWQRFENFFADMGERPFLKATLDRINSDLHYSCGHCEECLEKQWPPNCRWADYKRQANNRRRTIFLTFQDKTQSLSDWATELGIPYSRLKSRLKKYGWSVEKTLSLPKTNRWETGLSL